MTLSNILCDTVNLSLYDFDFEECLNIAIAADSIEFGVDNEVGAKFFTQYTIRNDQTDELLERLSAALMPCDETHSSWLSKRGIKSSGVYSINHQMLSEQDKLDSYLYPCDHILDEFGYKVVDGPCLCDFRNGKLVGICIRNISTDLEWVAAAKFTTSNYGFFLLGYDDYSPNDLVYVVEGVFDAIIMRKFGYNAIAVASAFPSAFQLACLTRKFKNLRICLDNDFHGWCGSLMVNRLLGSRIFFTGLKDAGCYANSAELIINEFDNDTLVDMVKTGAIAYNHAAASKGLTRNLPYN